MFAKTAKLAALLAVAAIALTACTPPMPPEVKAALLEQTHTCISGSANVAGGDALADAIPTIQGSMTAACTQMNLASVDQTAGSGADIWISPTKPTADECKAEITAPYALDAAVVAASLANAGGLILSPASVAGIFDGSITNWSDAKITADNGGVALGNEPIVVLPTTDANALKAFSAWYQHLTGKKFVAKGLTTKSQMDAADLGKFGEGSVALIPNSVFAVYSVNAMVPPLAAGILVDAKTAEQAVPDMSGIGSAGTQLTAVAAKNGVGNTVTMNFDAKPIAPEGSDVAPTPYGAIYPVSISLCENGAAATGGKAGKVAHAVARYLLRQDSEGTLTALTVLPELVRAESLDAVSAGLPQPKMPKTN
ncbi:MAG: hypothetical protein RJA35_1031 [Actinomycetota bacterium]